MQRSHGARSARGVAWGVLALGLASTAQAGSVVTEGKVQSDWSGRGDTSDTACDDLDENYNPSDDDEDDDGPGLPRTQALEPDEQLLYLWAASVFNGHYHSDWRPTDDLGDGDPNPDDPTPYSGIISTVEGEPSAGCTASGSGSGALWAATALLTLLGRAGARRRRVSI